MLRFYNDLVGTSVTDISSGRKIANVTGIVINPHNLSVAALSCYVRAQAMEKFLLTKDITDFKLNIVTVPNDSALSDLEELVRIKEFLGINYKVIGKKVITDSKKHVGVVNDFVIDDETFLVAKLYVRPPITKLLQSSDRIIGRNQIVEVSDKAITVRDTSIKAGLFQRVRADA